MSVLIDRRKILCSGTCLLAGAAVGQDASVFRKKGFGIALRSNPDWQEKLQKLNAKWFYTWGPNQPEPIPKGIEFIPMIWGKWNCNRTFVKQLAERGHDTLLGFNEPDQAKQSNIPVEEALRLWPLMMESGMRLGSPAGVHPEGEWMTAFMKESNKRDYKIDFISIHSYYGDNPKQFLNRLNKIHKLYNKSLWITEFAVADWEAREDKPNKYSADQVYQFMEAVLPALDKLDYIERYAWFSAPKPSYALAPSVLFDSDGSLNRLGKLYASF